MLGGLQGDVDACGLAQLPGPHAGAVDDELCFDVALIGLHAGDRAGALHDAGHRHTFDDGRASLSRTLGKCHRHVDGIGAAVFFHVEPGEHVVGTRQRKQIGYLFGRDLVHVDTAVAIERADPAVLLQPIRFGGQFDEPDAVETRRLTGLGLESGVEIAGVLAHLGRGLRQRTERHHQTGGVPRRARRQLVALQHDDVGATHRGEVIGDRATDHSSTDHHDSSAFWQRRRHGRRVYARRSPRPEAPATVETVSTRRSQSEGKNGHDD